MGVELGVSGIRMRGTQDSSFSCRDGLGGTTDVDSTWRQSGKDVDDPKKVPCRVWTSSAGIPQVEGQVPSMPYE